MITLADPISAQKSCQNPDRYDPTDNIALGRLVSGADLMAALLKGDQRLALMIKGNGPLQKLHAEAAFGHMRGSVKNPVAGLPPKKSIRLTKNIRAVFAVSGS